MNSLEEGKNKKRRRRKRSMYLYPWRWWMMAPFYGARAGWPSGATMPPNQPILTQPPTSAPHGRAYPGVGGINSPSVPTTAPNFGTGPVMTDIEYDGSLSKLNESLEFIINAISDLDDEGAVERLSKMTSAMPKAIQMSAQEGPSVSNLVQSRVHKAFTDLADDLYGLGYMSTEERIALSSCIGGSLESFDKEMEEKCQWAKTRLVDTRVAKELIEK